MALYGRSGARGVDEGGRVSVIIEGCYEGGFKGGGVVDTDECERRVTGARGDAAAGGRREGDG